MKVGTRKKRAASKSSRHTATPKVDVPMNLWGLPIDTRSPEIPEDVLKAWGKVAYAALDSADPDDIVRIHSALEETARLRSQVGFYQKMLKLVHDTIMPFADERYRAKVALADYNQKKGWTASDEHRSRAKELDASLASTHPIQSHRYDEIARIMGIKRDRVRTLLGHIRKGRPENRGKRKHKKK